MNIETYLPGKDQLMSRIYIYLHTGVICSTRLVTCRHCASLRLSKIVMNVSNYLKAIYTHIYILEFCKRMYLYNPEPRRAGWNIQLRHCMFCWFGEVSHSACGDTTKPTAEHQNTSLYLIFSSTFEHNTPHVLYLSSGAAIDCMIV